MITNCHLILIEKQELLWRMKVEGRVTMAIKGYNANFLGKEHQSKDKLFQNQFQ